jgi:hypothetical protein
MTARAISGEPAQPARGEAVQVEYDGSLDLYFQNEGPGRPRTSTGCQPRGRFKLTKPIYAAKSGALTGHGIRQRSLAFKSCQAQSLVDSRKDFGKSAFHNRHSATLLTYSSGDVVMGCKNHQADRVETPLFRRR